MITFIIFNIILFIIVMNNKTISINKILLAYFICIFCSILFGLEYITGNVEMFASDEEYYVNVALNGSFSINDNRFLWYLINHIMLKYDIFGMLFLKLINIPILISTLVLLSSIFNTDKIFNILFILPYLAFMTVYNLRDILILFVISLLSYYFYKNKYIKTFMTSILLFLLRPQYVFVVYFTFFILYLFKREKKRKKVKVSKSKLFSILVLVILAIGLVTFNFDRISTLIEKNITAIERRINNEDEFIQRMQRTGSTGRLLRDLPVSMMKYIFSPLPTSLLNRILNGGESQWSITDDIIRFINQCGYYLLLLYITINVKLLKPIILSFNKMQLSVLIVLFSYMPIYSFYLYGVMHQRLRTPFQIMIFILAVAIESFSKSPGIIKKEDGINERSHNS